MGLEDRELLPVFDADSPFEIEAVGDIVMVLLPLKVEEGVMEGELVLLDVGVPLEVGEEVMGGVEDAEKETLGEVLDETPWVSEGVGEELTVLLPVTVVVDVMEAVPVLLLVGLTVGKEEGVCVPVGLEDRELLPVFDAESPFEIEEEGVTVSVLLPLSVEEGVSDPVRVPLFVGVAVEVGVGVGGGVKLPDRD